MEELGAIHFPPFSQQNILKVKSDYTNKPDVKALTKSRGGISSDRGIFRDIHDVFMDDYIEERRKKKASDDCCFFVTTNTELVKFCNGRNVDSRMRTIGASKIILELWMHNTKQSGLESTALTEMIARCMDMNSRDVRNKLGIVAKYYNATKREDFDLKVFQEITRCLYKRDKDVIAAVEELKGEDEVKVDVNMRIIVEKAHESSRDSANQLSDIQKQVEKLQNMLEASEQEKRAAFESSQEKAKKTEDLEEKLTESIEKTRKQGHLLNKYAEKDRLISQLNQLEKDLGKLEAAKVAYIHKHDHYKLYLWLEVCLIIVFVFSLIYGIYQAFIGGSWTIAIITAALSSLKPLFTAITRKSLYIIERQAIHDEIKVKAQNLWLSLNPDYTTKKNQQVVLQDKISELERTIQDELR